MDFDEMMAAAGDFNPALKWSAQAGELSIKTATGWEEVPLPAKFTLDLATARFGWREWVQTPDGSRPEDNAVRIGEQLLGTKPADASSALFLVAHSDKWVDGVEGLAEWVPTSITVNRALQPVIAKFRELSVEDQKTKAMAIGVVGKVKVGKNDHRAPDVKFKIVDRPAVFSDQPSSPAVADAAAGPLPASAAPEPSPSSDKVDEWAEFEAA